MLLTRPYKVVYQDGDRIIKVFTKEHGKANVFNEALCQARVEESGLAIPKVLEVSQIDGEWAIAIEYAPGKTLEQLMAENPEQLEQYMEQFVELQLSMHSKFAPRLTLQKDKFARKISSLKNIVDATIRYELHTRLDSMPHREMPAEMLLSPIWNLPLPTRSWLIFIWSFSAKKVTLPNNMCRNGFLSPQPQNLARARKTKKNFS